MKSANKEALPSSLGVLGEPLAVSLIQFAAVGRGEVSFTLRMVGSARIDWGEWIGIGIVEGQGRGQRDGGRCSPRRTWAGLDVEAGGTSSSSSHPSNVVSPVVSASARMFRIL